MTDDKFADMWKKSRNDAGRSQQWIADALGVSKKTVQNWEDGITCPSISMGFEWFKALGLQPMHYYLDVIYPDGHTNTNDEQEINKALIAFVTGIPLEYKEKILYFAYGDHGSSPFCVLDMVSAHLHLPLKDRIMIANMIMAAHGVNATFGDLVNEGTADPDIDRLRLAIRKCRESVLNGDTKYTVL